MKKLLAVLLIMLGAAFIGLAIYYWATPAGSLPHHFPGYQAGSTHKHLKHGFAAVILGVGCFIVTWFLTGDKNKTNEA